MGHRKKYKERLLQESFFFSGRSLSFPTRIAGRAHAVSEGKKGRRTKDELPKEESVEVSSVLKDRSEAYCAFRQL